MKLIQKNVVNTRKQLEKQGYGKIVSNEFYQYGDEGDYKYVLELNNNFKLATEATVTKPSKTIGELLYFYNRGIVYDPKDQYQWHMFDSLK